MRVCVGLIILAACIWVPASYLSAGFGKLPQVSALASRRIAQILRQRWRKTTNAAPTTLSAIQAASQSSLINADYTPLVISGNDKNKQLTLLSQRNLALLTYLDT